MRVNVIRYFPPLGRMKMYIINKYLDILFWLKVI